MIVKRQQRVPVLRFKEFNDDWVFKSLSNFASKVKKKNSDKTESLVLTNSAQHGIVSQTDYFDREIVNTKNLDGYYVVNVDDFIYNPRKSASALVGPIKRNHLKKGVASPLYTIFRFNKGNLDFLEQYFNSTKWHQYLRNVANYGARFDRMSIVDKDFFNLPLPSINENEQQKIAAFLLTVDTKIEQLNRQKTLLGQCKQGMMQKLFSREIRFKDDEGAEYPDWKEKLLGDLSNFSKGKGISKSDIVSDGSVKCIRYGELYTQYGTTISHVVSSTDIPISQLVLSKKNDVIIPSSGETASDIATVACVRLDGVALGGDINMLRGQQNGVFLAYYLNYKKPDIARLAQGISVVHLYASQLRSLKLSIPSKEEQQKIADFLSAIDKKIELVTSQIEQARSFKTGLLQQMFI